MASLSLLRNDEPVNILISGASGLIGSALIPHLTNAGHEVHTLVRRSPANKQEHQWQPETGYLDPAVVRDFDAIINLSGAGVGDKRWTASYKAEILQSRLTATRALANALAASGRTDQVLINGSAIGFYGDRGSEIVDEQSAPAHDFLANVVTQWEAATQPASKAGVRVVFARTGLVVSSRGGAFGKLLPLFRFGLGGVIGSGKQFWPLISMTDLVRAIEFCLTHPIAGPVNFTAPVVPTNREVTKALATHLHRPALLPVPGFALHLALGGFAAGITGGADVRPRVLERLGFEWKHRSAAEIFAGEITR